MEREVQRDRPTRPPPANASAAHSVSSQHPDLANLKNFHDEAYLYIQQGLSCDDLGHGEQAVTLYRKGIQCIERGQEICCEGADKTGPQWEKARKMKSKMARTQSQIEVRIDHLLRNDTNAARAATDPPPSYESATTPTSATSESEFDSLFESVGDSIMAEEMAGSSGQTMPAHAIEIFTIPDGVQIYFITTEGHVSAPSYPSSLGIYRLQDQTPAEASNHVTPPAFLSIGDWTYPLLPGRSPVLHADSGAYIFPDVNSPEEGAAVGVIIPESVSQETKARLESMFKRLTDLRTVQPPPAARVPPTPPQVAARGEVPEARAQDENRTSTQISQGIVTAAEWISWGLGKGAEKTGELLKKGSTKLREQLVPENQPRAVDPRAQTGMRYARTATNTAVKVSAFIVDGLGKATMALGRQVAPHIRNTGEKILPKSMTDRSGGRSKVDDVVEVAAGGLKGFGTIWLGLEQAGKILARSVADETTSVVTHKYGQEVGNVTENALYTVGNAALTAHNARNLGIKAIAKRTAKDAGKAVLEDYPSRPSHPDSQFKPPPGGPEANQRPNLQ